MRSREGVGLAPKRNVARKNVRNAFEAVPITTRHLDDGSRKAQATTLAFAKPPNARRLPRMLDTQQTSERFERFQPSTCALRFLFSYSSTDSFESALRFFNNPIVAFVQTFQDPFAQQRHFVMTAQVLCRCVIVRLVECVDVFGFVVLVGRRSLR